MDYKRYAEQMKKEEGLREESRLRKIKGRDQASKKPESSRFSRLKNISGSMKNKDEARKRAALKKLSRG